MTGRSHGRLESDVKGQQAQPFEVLWASEQDDGGWVTVKGVAFSVG